MKTRRKALALAMAALCLGSAAMPMGVSAASYVAAYDANQDGEVTILDNIAINRYLAGYFYVANTAQMDADGNLIVNRADAACVMAHLIGNPYTCTFIDVTA